MLRLRQSYRNFRRALRTVRAQGVPVAIQTHVPKLTLGHEGARWCVRPDKLDSTRTIYSFGVGEDISFDLAIIKEFGVCVNAFDPTPRCIRWLGSQNLPADFVFHPFGVAAFDGSTQFVPPQNPRHVSHTLLPRPSSSPAIDLPVYRLVTIMQMLGHTSIDLLKMDIEGAEYQVISDLLGSNVRPLQILVEFHHRWPEVGVQQTRNAIRSLNDVGYLIFDVSESGEEYSFTLEG